MKFFTDRCEIFPCVIFNGIYLYYIHPRLFLPCYDLFFQPWRIFFIIMKNTLESAVISSFSVFPLFLFISIKIYTLFYSSNPHQYQHTFIETILS